jgi:hypothetical protein
MRPSIFISHADRDRATAEVLASTITRVSLRQIEVWFSSDPSPSGGLQPGDNWVTQIFERLRSSKTVLALVTPSSIDRPWMHFECGFVAAQGESHVVPICLGVDPNRLPPPLGLYQSYQATDARSLSALIAKLLERFSIHYDEDMARPVVTDALRSLSTTRAAEPKGEEPLPPTTATDLLEKLQATIDRRFLELARLVSPRDTANREEDHPSYSVPVQLDIFDIDRTDFFVIRPSTTVQEVLDNLYFALDRKVPPYTYLSEWILLRVNRTPPAPLITRGLNDIILASAVFTPESKWMAVRLKRPYQAGSPVITLTGQFLEDPNWGP